MANRKKKNASSDSDGEDYYDQDYEFSEQPSSIIIDKVLGRKFIKIASDNSNGEVQYEELFFIKWRNMSYLHASWEKREDLERVDPNAKTKLKRFLLSPHAPGIVGEIRGPTEQIQPALDANGLDEEEDEVDYFHPDLVEIQRIISCDTASCWHSKAKKHTDLLKAPPSSSCSQRSCKNKYFDIPKKRMISLRNLFPKC